MTNVVRTHLFSFDLLGGLSGSGGWHWRSLGGILISFRQIAFLLAFLLGLFALDWGGGLVQALRLLFVGAFALRSQHVGDEVED